MAVAKIDPKVIFASEAPAQDTPAVFKNKTVGWGESRKNGGRPTIKQSNALQQETDLKILWLNENSVTPFDATIDYPENAVTLKDDVFKILKLGVWEVFLDKSSVGLINVDNTSDLNKPVSTATQTALNLKADKSATYTKVEVDNAIDLLRPPYLSSDVVDGNQTQDQINLYGGKKYDLPVGGYPLDARVLLDNGDIVKSTVDGNTNDPNVNMTGWIKASNTIEVGSISELLSISNPLDKTVVKVLSYYVSENKGGGNFVFFSGDTATPDSVRVFEHTNGRWVRQNWNYASIYDAGIKADGTDETDKLQNLITAAKGLPISLKGKTVKTNGFSIGSHTQIFNGGLDFSASTVITEAYRFFDGYIIGDNRPRTYNAEYSANYATLEQLENISIHHVNFILPANPVSAFRAVFFHKINDLKFKYNTLNASNGHTWLQVVGGHDGTNLTGISPDAYVENLLNGRNNGIEIIGNKMIGTQKTLTGGQYISHSFCRILSSENILVRGNNIKNVTSGVAIDGYNRKAEVSHNYYEVDTATYALFPQFDSADTIGFYAGQGTYDIEFHKNYVKNYGHSGIYAEAAKSCTITANRVDIDFSLTPITADQGVGIRAQSNNYAMGGANLTEYGSVIGFDISGNIVNSLRSGVVLDGVFASSHKDFVIANNTIKSALNNHAVFLGNSYNITVANNQTNGSLGLGAVDTANIVGNTFSNASNYALVLYSDNKTKVQILDNVFECYSGPVIYNNMPSGNAIKIQGGAIYNRGVAATLFNNNSGTVEATDFETTLPSVNISLAQDLVMSAGSSHKFEYALTGVKDGWQVQAWMDSPELFYDNVAIDLNINAICRNNKIVFIVRNIGTGSNTSNVFFTARLRPYLNNQYVN